MNSVPVSEKDRYSDAALADSFPSKKLVVLENMVHEDVYRDKGFELVVQQTNAGFKEHMPAWG